MEYKDLSKKYESLMTYDMLDKLPSEEREALEKEANEKGVFKMSHEEYLRWRKFNDMHHECQVGENGFSRFGAIGGGMKLTYYNVGDGKYNVHAFCEGCGTGINLTTQSLGITEEDFEKADEDIKRRYESYSRDSMGVTEYVRYKAFIEDHKDDLEFIHVSFIGTGLGSIICVFDDKTMEKADVTDIDCW